MEEGIVLYDIELDGCLNGVYTNEHPTVDGNIYNEINRRQDKVKGDNWDINGVYECFYFDLNNQRINATLTISYAQGRTNTYNFVWREIGQTVDSFTGIGYKMNPRQIAVHYSSL